jgi:hypothetical protein
VAAGLAHLDKPDWYLYFVSEWKLRTVDPLVTLGAAFLAMTAWDGIPMTVYVALARAVDMREERGEEVSPGQRDGAKAARSIVAMARRDPARVREVLRSNASQPR